MDTNAEISSRGSVSYLSLHYRLVMVQVRSAKKDLAIFFHDPGPGSLFSRKSGLKVGIITFVRDMQVLRDEMGCL